MFIAVVNSDPDLFQVKIVQKREQVHVICLFKLFICMWKIGLQRNARLTSCNIKGGFWCTDGFKVLRLFNNLLIVVLWLSGWEESCIGGPTSACFTTEWGLQSPDGQLSKPHTVWLALLHSLCICYHVS